MSPGVLAIAGALVAIAFLGLMIGMLEMGFGVRISNVVRMLLNAI